MGQLLIGGVIFSTLLTSFLQMFAWSGWTKGFLGLYSGCIEASIANVLPYRSEGGPHFDSSLLKENLASYVQENMIPYCENTTYAVSYSEPDGQGEYLATTISFEADFGFHSVSRSATFRIVEVGA